MARFDHNIFSKSNGSIGGITFSQARAREGKVQTARERVIPSNPDTPPQQNTRLRMKDAQTILANTGAEIYRRFWNRQVEKLAGAQSLISKIMAFSRLSSTGDTMLYDNPPLMTASRGIGPAPISVSLGSGPTEFVLNFGSTTPENALPSDRLCVVSWSRATNLSIIQGGRHPFIIYNPISGISITRRSAGGAEIYAEDNEQGASGISGFMFFIRDDYNNDIAMSPIQFFTRQS